MVNSAIDKLTTEQTARGLLDTTAEVREAVVTPFTNSPNESLACRFYSEAVLAGAGIEPFGRSGRTAPGLCLAVCLLAIDPET